MKLICFTSAQGGVGCSQIVTNTAYLLSTLGRRVGVIDLNGKKTAELLKSAVLNRQILINNPGDSDPLTLIKRWRESGVEYVLANTPILNTFEIEADYILIVTTPLRLALIKNMRLVRLVKESGLNVKIGIILNKVGECEECEYSKNIVEKILGAPVLYQIPYDKSFIKSEQLGEPVSKISGKTGVVISLLKLVNQLFEIPIPIQKRENPALINFISRFLKR